MKVLVTGSDGFIGRNLKLHLSECGKIDVIEYTRNSKISDLDAILSEVDFIFHLAGINRPSDPSEFTKGNIDLTRDLCNAIAASGRKIPIIYTSSNQATQNNPYGISKRAAESELLSLRNINGNPVHIFRLPNVFGKWSRPNYNSVVSTFCHNIAHDLPIKIDDSLTPLSLVYIDDVINRFIELMDGADSVLDLDGFEVVNPVYNTTVGELAGQIQAFKESRSTLISERVGSGLVRALYSTYISYLPTSSFSYAIPRNSDARGSFVEVLKTLDYGQFSYFTAKSGVTRGGHYHHTKTEKFLVVKGSALFKFKNMNTQETFEIRIDDKTTVVVETIPGWAHDITNIGGDEMLVMLWANEIFDRGNPDTYPTSL